MIALLLAALLSGPAEKDGVFVLGIDGMDPVILSRLIDEGKMPNFARLAAEGAFQSLGTSNPPQSPVAWSNFVTGANPGGHGIFDFIHRDPRTYSPISSATPPVTGEPPAALRLFGYVIPLGGDEVVNNRSGTPFWDVLHAAGVETEVYRIPGNYPPTPSEALTLTGMGTIDMRGEYGTYTWYTDEPILDSSHLKADLQVVTVDDEDFDGVPDTVRARLVGPPDVLRLEPGAMPRPDQYLAAPVTVHLDPEDEVVWLKVGDADAILREGEWSDWLEVSFDALPWGMMPLQGNVRFYMKEVRPTFRLYASPVNIAPGAPAQPITTPDDDAAAMLHEAIGNFYTQGFPEEINALKDELFDDDDYVAQVELVREESDLMLDLALSRFEPGDMTFVYQSDIDLQCHLLWRHGDPKTPGAPNHPAWEAAAAAKHKSAIENYYVGSDATLGRVREALPDGTLLIVLSDHGFQAQTREVHLNGWLRDNGYLTLNDGATTSGPAFMDVDWSRTKAYAVGFNGLYLNLQGREGEGLVAPGEAEALTVELIEGLTAWVDPKTGAHPIRRVDRASVIYSGERLAEAPDMLVGYEAGYGCSETSTLGEIVEGVLDDNTDRWSGNHLMAPEVVPGVLLLNRKLPGDGHALADVTATLLDHFDQPLADGMIGASIFEN